MRRRLVVGMSPRQQRFHGACVDDPVDGNFALECACAAVGLPGELSGGVGVAIDRKHAAHLDGEAKEPARGIAPFRAGVHFDGRAEAGAGGEDHLGVELGFGAAFAAASLIASAILANEPPGAVAKDIDVGVGDGGDHPAGHLRGGHTELAVDAGDDDIEFGEEGRVLVERAVVEDIDFDAREDAEGGEALVEFADDH